MTKQVDKPRFEGRHWGLRVYNEMLPLVIFFAFYYGYGGTSMYSVISFLAVHAVFVSLDRLKHETSLTWMAPEAVLFFSYAAANFWARRYCRTPLYTRECDAMGTQWWGIVLGFGIAYAWLYLFFTGIYHLTGIGKKSVVTYAENKAGAGNSHTGPSQWEYIVHWLAAVVATYMFIVGIAVDLQRGADGTGREPYVNDTSMFRDTVIVVIVTRCVLFVYAAWCIMSKQFGWGRGVSRLSVDDRLYLGVCTADGAGFHCDFEPAQVQA
jgi:hypothetical protein